MASVRKVLELTPRRGLCPCGLVLRNQQGKNPEGVPGGDTGEVGGSCSAGKNLALHSHVGDLQDETVPKAASVSWESITLQVGGKDLSRRASVVIVRSSACPIKSLPRRPLAAGKHGRGPSCNFSPRFSFSSPTVP